MRRLLLLPALAAAALVAACPAFDENDRYACTSDDDCRSAVGERCVEGACAVPLEPCGNGRCDPDECTACPADCVWADCSTGLCNSDGSCDPDENCFGCPQDCVEASCGRCGDEGSCEPTECELDCGECSGHPICVADPCGPGHPSNEWNCTDLLDEDCDGNSDCADEDCAGLPDCQLPEEDCFSPGDEDQDFTEQCSDDDCAAYCSGGEECGGGLDDDQDGYFDCADPDCFYDASCTCGDGSCDPATECGVCFDCDGAAACVPGGENCGDGLDDDLDGLTDCADPGCAVSCATETECGAGMGDGDFDGWASCDDLDCWQVDPCTVAAVEDCGNGHDDTAGNAGGDANSDCQDTECVQQAGCALSCGSSPVTSALPGGTDPSAPIVRLNALSATEALAVTCEDVTAQKSFVLSWRVPVDGAYRFHTRGSSSRSVLSVTQSGSCPSSVGCDLSPEDGTESVVELGLAATDIVLILLAPVDAGDRSQLWLWIERTG